MRGNLWDDPRVAGICDAIGCNEAPVIGALYWLWASADQHTDSGFLPGLTIRGIDRKTGVEGFGEALQKVGWLVVDEEGVRIPKFDDHNSESAKKRAADAKRKANVRNVSAKSPQQSGQTADKKRRNAELEKEKEKEKSKSINKFKRPKVEEIAAYCLERKNSVDAQTFFDHYEANGWLRGKNKIKDWKACVRTWEKNQEQRNSGNGRFKTANDDRAERRVDPANVYDENHDYTNFGPTKSEYLKEHGSDDKLSD